MLLKKKSFPHAYNVTVPSKTIMGLEATAIIAKKYKIYKKDSFLKHKLLIAPVLSMLKYFPNILLPSSTQLLNNMLELKNNREKRFLN